MIYTQKSAEKHSVTANSATADKITTARVLTVSDSTHSTSVNFDGSVDVTLNLPTHISVPTVQSTAALIMPTADSGPANGIFVVPN